MHSGCAVQYNEPSSFKVTDSADGSSKLTIRLNYPLVIVRTSIRASRSFPNSSIMKGEKSSFSSCPPKFGGACVVRDVVVVPVLYRLSSVRPSTF